MLEFHPLANWFPLIEGADFEALVEDIRQNDIHDKIVILDGRILDGRNRYRAGVEAGLISPDFDLSDKATFTKYFTYYGPPPGKGLPGPSLDEVAQWVISKNLHRRHLDTGQRAAIGTMLEQLGHGGRRKSDQDANLRLDREAVSAIVNVSSRTLDSMAKVRDAGAPELNAAVRQGEISVSAAEKLADLPKERQLSILDQLRDDTGKIKPEVKKALAPVIKEIRAEKLAEKREKRESREKVFAARVLAMPTQKFGIALEDFEWDHKPRSRETGMDRHPSNHYPTAADAHTPEEIVARCAERFSYLAPDCILFKWSTGPHLWIAMQVMALQGFEYKTHLAWGKERPGNARGPGYWFTGEHELLLVGVRGNIEPPSDAVYRSLFSAPVGEHSEKPMHPYEIIEHHWPNVPKIEFNARATREGWFPWGFEAPATECVDDLGSVQDAHKMSTDGQCGEALSTSQGERAPSSNSVTGGESAADFSDDDERDEWQALQRVSRGGAVLARMLRHLIGCGLVVEGDDLVQSLTADGVARLAELTAAFAPDTSNTDPLDIPAFLRRRKGDGLPERGAA